MASTRTLPDRSCWLAQFLDSNGNRYCRTTHIPHSPPAPPDATPDEVKALQLKNRELAKEVADILRQAVCDRPANETAQAAISSLRKRANNLTGSTGDTDHLARRLSELLKKAGQAN